MNINELWTAPIVAGSGAKNAKNCSVELLGKIIYGDMRHGYHLPCVDAAAQSATVAVSDRLSDEARQSRRWRLLIARLGTCHNTHSTRLDQRMALWSARSVEHHSGDPRVRACNDTVERWLAGEASLEDVTASAAEAWAAASAEAAARAAAGAGAASAAAASAASTWAEAAAAAWAGAGAAARAAVAAEAAEGDDVLTEWLDAYLTAWHKAAADEGLLAGEIEDELVRFVESLDWEGG